MTHTLSLFLLFLFVVAGALVTLHGPRELLREWRERREHLETLAALVSAAY